MHNFFVQLAGLGEVFRFDHSFGKASEPPLPSRSDNRSTKAKIRLDFAK